MAIWNNTKWTLDDATLSIKGKIMGSSSKKTNAFKFVAHRSNGKIVFYKIEKLRNSSLPALWTSMVLFPRGADEPQLTPSGSAMPPFTDPVPAQFLTRAIQIKGQLLTAPSALRFGTQRLEGDMTIDGVRHAVTMWQAPKEFDPTQPMLVVAVVADGPTNPDGVGTGHPKP